VAVVADARFGVVENMLDYKRPLLRRGHLLFDSHRTEAAAPPRLTGHSRRSGFLGGRLPQSRAPYDVVCFKLPETRRLSADAAPPRNRRKFMPFCTQEKNFLFGSTFGSLGCPKLMRTTLRSIWSASTMRARPKHHASARWCTYVYDKTPGLGTRAQGPILASEESWSATPCIT
jgi:hypothetical protein